MLIEILLIVAACLASAAVLLAAEDLIGYMKRQSVIQLITQSLPGLRSLAVELLLVAVAFVPALSSLAVLRDLKATVPGLAIISDWIGIQTVLVALVPVIIFAVVHLLTRTKQGKDPVKDQ